MSERVPDCTTAHAAEIAGIISAAVMAGEMSLTGGGRRGAVSARIKASLPDLLAEDVESLTRDIDEGVRVATLMIEARARSFVRTPSQAALSGAEAALALAEDAVDPNLSWNDGEKEPDAFTVLASIRDTLRTALYPLHAAEGQAPYDAGPAGQKPSDQAFAAAEAGISNSVASPDPRSALQVALSALEDVCRLIRPGPAGA